MYILKTRDNPSSALGHSYSLIHPRIIAQFVELSDILHKLTPCLSLTKKLIESKPSDTK